MAAAEGTSVDVAIMAILAELGGIFAIHKNK